MLTLRDQINLPGLSFLFGIALFPPVITTMAEGITRTEFKDWYFLWWLYQNGMQPEIDSLASLDVAYPWAIFVNVFIAWWGYRNWWFCFSYQVHYCLGHKKLIPVVKACAENMLYGSIVTVTPLLVLIITQHLTVGVIETFQCRDARIWGDLIGILMACSAADFCTRYQRDRLDELDLLADQQRLRPPLLPKS